MMLDSLETTQIFSDFPVEQLNNDELITAFRNLSITELKENRTISKRFNTIATSALKMLLHNLIANLTFIGGKEAAEGTWHLVWEENDFESFKRSWQEQQRELLALHSHPKLGELKSSLQAAINLPCEVQTFFDRNQTIEKANVGLINKHSNMFATLTQSSNFTLDLENVGLTRIPYALLEHLFNKIVDEHTAISEIKLANNNIKHLPALFWIINSFASFLYLENNKIESITDDMLAMDKLLKLDLNGNLLKTLSGKVAQRLKDIKYADDPNDILRKQYQAPLFSLATMKKGIAQGLKLTTAAIPVLFGITSLLDSLGTFDNLPKEGEQIPFDEKMAMTSVPLGILGVLLSPALEYTGTQLEYFKRNSVWSLATQYPESIPENTPESEAYLNGREAKNGWLPYLGSYFNRANYKKEYYVGQHDAQNKLPNRVNRVMG